MIDGSYNHNPEATSTYAPNFFAAPMPFRCSDVSSPEVLSLATKIVVPKFSEGRGRHRSGPSQDKKCS